MQTLSRKHIRKIFRPRKPDSHKGDHGHALIIAGNKGRMGAAVIAAKACLRAGCGLLTVMIPEEQNMILQVAVPEAMLLSRGEAGDLQHYAASGVGPATGTDEGANALLKKIIAETRMPLLLDADALTLIAKDKSLFDALPAGTILTPHPKEFDRIFGEHADEEQRRLAAISYAAEKNTVIVLKGHQTLITNGIDSCLNKTGNAGLAKGGSGDALTGIITALLAQKYDPFDAAKLGVYLHGSAADLALKEQSTESMVITDVIEFLGRAFKKLNTD